MIIQVLEDDRQLQCGLEELLTNAGYQVKVAASMAEAKLQQQKCSFDLYILDVMLESSSGFSYCKEIRLSEDTPILFLTARDDEESVLDGFQAGADDYITKPFRSRELLARVAAHLRRRSKNDDDGELRSGGIVLNTYKGTVSLNGEEIALRKVEYELLVYFMESCGRLLQREQILEYIWDQGENFVEDSTLTVQISRLRKRLGRYQGQQYIETVRGIGYRWCQKLL